MHPTLLYLLKMLLCSGILYGYYRVALYNERFHQWNRFYLLAAMLLSIVLPLIEIPLLSKAQPTPVVYVLDVLPWNNAVQTESAATPNAFLSLSNIMKVVVGFISLLLLVKFATSIFKIFRHYHQALKSNLDDVKVIFTQEPSAPYSFFNWLFWRSDMDVDSPAGKRILKHELTHIRQKHSLDKLFTELVLIILWINPFFWLIRKELYMIHEFLADQNAVEQQNGSAFAEMIMQSIHINPIPVLANPIFTSQIKRRLFMITSSNTNKYSYIKRILTMGIVGCTIFLIACTAEKTEEPVKPIDIKLAEESTRPAIRNLQTLDLPVGTLIYLDGQKITASEMKKLNPDLLDYDVMLTKEASIEKYGVDASNGAYELFSIPTTANARLPGNEHLPSFPGGKAEWSIYLQKQLRYPDIAIDKGTMGVAKIAFTVLPDGSIKNVTIVENPGDSLGEEALRFIKQGPKWVPGKVNGKATTQRILVPITFLLE